MAALDRLAPDQRAALMLILQQGQSYDDLAGLLATDQAAIRARAHAAVDIVASELAEELDPVQRGEITDYMLGQQGDVQQAATRKLLSRSPSARAWARSVSQELARLMSDRQREAATAPDRGGEDGAEGSDRAAGIATPTPELHDPQTAEAASESSPTAERDDVATGPEEAPAPPPDSPAPAQESPAAAQRGGVAGALRSASERRAARAAVTSAGDTADTASDQEPKSGAHGSQRPAVASGSASAAASGESGPWAPGEQVTRPASTRLGGIILIAVAAVAIVAGIVLFANGGGSTTSTPSTGSTSGGAAPAGTGATGTSGPQGAGQVQVVVSIPLSAADGSGAKGAAEVVQQQGTNTRAFLVAATGLRPSTSTSAYAVWLYNTSSDALSLGFFAQSVGPTGQLEGTAAVPANISRYAQIIVTRETTGRPARPGTVVLRGTLKLPAG